MNLCDIKTVKNIMEAFGLRFRKEFGQNFLTNHMIVSDIADCASDSVADSILEIGPGLGTLTRELCERYSKVLALEIDKGLIPALGYTLNDFHNVQVVNEDVMKADLNELLAPYFAEGGVSVCANLPYYITTPILMKLLESGLPFRYITIMIQSEVADRLTAKAGSAAYGAITAMLNYYGTAERLFTVSAGNFMPPPSVNSAVVRIKLHEQKPYQPKDEEIFRKTVKAAFEQRRKTLPNALSAGFPTLSKEQCVEAVVQAGHRPDIRGERLDVAQFVTLADILTETLQA